ncbi:uncharacterized protein ATNIH1004_000065 [Aspergillus tanneri]|uniref:FMN-dependent dehydrogenase domain-containing protein n=1 Tax=Aspergillus tanneri TaxID=1220188 RepID=A0A5M9N9A5_9EURO|nr:uncharacterized protein ATNIH1004_000065 [Aspergillus tanneri]KAA8651187.1 hypothetical protein ATNIH1004_000065 [Aspergillus tanneri]
MQIWIKGILTAEDVLLARQYGCDECIRAVGGQIRVHINGGIRTRIDIFKALHCGRKAVGLDGRHFGDWQYCDDEKGVSRVLDILYGELKRCIQLTGCGTLADISMASIGVFKPDGPLARL